MPTITTTMVMESLRNKVFHKKFELHDREMLWKIGRWGITGTITLDPGFLLQMLLLLILTQLLCSLVAIVTFYGIIEPETRNQRPRDSIQSLLLGYGLLAPLLLYTPYWLIQTLDIRNCLLLLNMVGSPVMATIRLNEALLAQEIPYFSRDNVGLYILYFAVPVVLDHDDYKPVNATRRQIFQKVWKVMSLFLQGTVFLSLLTEYDYKMFPSRPISSCMDLLYWGNLANNLMAASLVSVMLDLGCTFGEVVLYVLTGGWHFVNSHNDPITAATSVSDFWGKRWNQLVASILKRGVYGPMRRILPRAPAAIVTFLTSGLAHEYMLHVLSSARGPNVIANNLWRQPYQYKFGHQFTFFLWNGLLLLLEECWRGHWSLVLVKQCIPRTIRTILLMLLVLPITHWFTDEYDKSGIFRDTATAFPQIKFIPNSTPLLSHPILDDLIVQGQNWTRNWFDAATPMDVNNDGDAAVTSDFNALLWTIINGSHGAMNVTMELITP